MTLSTAGEWDGKSDERDGGIDQERLEYLLGDGPVEGVEAPDENRDGENLVPVVMPESTQEPPEGLRNDPEEYGEPIETWRPPALSARRKGTPLRKKKQRKIVYSGKERILIMDTFRRSGLPIKDFAPLVGISPHTLYKWRKIYEEAGLPGLLGESRKGQRQSRLPEVTRRAILMLKEDNPDWGCQRIADMLSRGQGIGASPGAINRVLNEAGYEVEETPSRQHAPLVRRFERAKPNQLWQTDLFTFMLKRQNRRVYLVGYMDDHSRFIVGWGLHAGSSAAMVIDTMKAAIANYQAPEEILTDNGPQYVSWRGKSQFSKAMDKLGIRHIVATPKRPKTLGKIERFWGTLWRELIETSIFLDVEDARTRIGHFVDYYNFQRTHQGIDGLYPADRFFGAAPEVLRSLKERVKENALELAKKGCQPKPFYLTGQAGGKNFSVHTRGDKVILHRAGESQQEVDLAEVGEPLPDPVSKGADLTQADPVEPERPPGCSPLDEGLKEIQQAISNSQQETPEASEGGES